MTGREKALIIALIPFGVAMLLIGLAFGSGYWQAGDPTARWLLLAAGIGGASYIFVISCRALRRR